MKKKTIFLATISILLIVLVSWWCIHITILQLKFSNECDKYGERNDYDECDVSFLSYPISNINGECNCYSISRKSTYRNPTKTERDAKVSGDEQ